MTTQDSPRTPDAAETACCDGHGCAPAAARAERPGSSRRSVLQGGALAAAAGAASLGLAGCTQEIKDESTAREHFAGSTKTPVVAAADLPVGASRSVTANGRTLLVHRVDETTVTAFSDTCTHQGCQLQVAERPEGPAYRCPCHGSHFDVSTGVPFGGPARKPLMDFEAALEDGQVVVKL